MAKWPLGNVFDPQTWSNEPAGKLLVGIKGKRLEGMKEGCQIFGI
jgi:hypothetical protein